MSNNHSHHHPTMGMAKLDLAILFGGRSTEHQISLLSVRGILSQINKDKYNISLIYIDMQGNWFLTDEIDSVNKTAITLISGKKGASIITIESGVNLQHVDVIFPVLHGAFGEDGTMQGYFKMINVAFVGCGVLASSACFDKDMTKRVLRDAGIAITPYAMAAKEYKPSFKEMEAAFGTPLFIKPANSGSSVGVFKVSNADEYAEKLNEALVYDRKVLIEKTIVGKEIECAVLGNEMAKAALAGEFIMPSGFHDFESNSKYPCISCEASICIPADITSKQMEIVRATAVKAYKAMGCEGLSRVDFFIANDGEILVNEINTIPGFTDISMYPKTWEATGIQGPELIDTLIELAIERYNNEQKLKIFTVPVS